MSLIDKLWEIGCSLVPHDKYYDLKIEGIWNTNLIFQPLPYECIFDCNLLIVYTCYQGCSFYEGNYIDSEKIASVVGEHFISAKNSILPVKIATLDSLFGFGRGRKKPDLFLEKDGLPHEKAHWRAKIVCNEVHRLFPNKSTKITIFGVSGGIVHELLRRGYEVENCDINPNIVGKSICGIMVRNYEYFKKEYIEKSDAIIVTGMTIETQTLEEIIRLSKKSNTWIIVYAQTGANMAPWYINYGVDSVVCENMPFYDFEGLSRIRVFRRKTCTDQLQE